MKVAVFVCVFSQGKFHLKLGINKSWFLGKTFESYSQICKNELPLKNLYQIPILWHPIAEAKTRLYYFDTAIMR